jgi:hypothetical protein
VSVEPRICLKAPKISSSSSEVKICTINPIGHAIPGPMCDPPVLRQRLQVRGGHKAAAIWKKGSLRVQDRARHEIGVLLAEHEASRVLVYGVSAVDVTEHGCA